MTSHNGATSGSPTTVLLIGTRKGLWIATSPDRRSWDLSGPDDVMGEVHAVAIDKGRASPRLLMASRHWHIGPQVRHSDDLGQTWHSAADGGVQFEASIGSAVEAVWALAPSASEPGVVFAGTEPSALFRSEDGGVRFNLVRSLWDHPHRSDWQPGAGGQAIHTLLPHPDDPAQMSVAMSTGGIYQTRDAGGSWAPANTGIKCEFMPDEISYPQYGQCVHKAARAAGDPQVLYAQNHGGVYRSDDGGARWVSIAEGLPAEFGFPIVAHPHRTHTAWVFPLASSYSRFPPGEAASVWRTDDGGTTWRAQANGLPKQFYAVVLRDAMCSDDHQQAGVYFGSREGTVYASADEGDTWTVVAEHLPDVLCVRAASIGA